MSKNKNTKTTKVMRITALIIAGLFAASMVVPLWSNK